MTKLYSQEIERACLSLGIRFPEKLIDVLPYITEDHFLLDPHKIIFQCIRLFLNNSEKFDTLLLIDKVKNLGLNHIDGVDIADYITSLKRLNNVNEETFAEHFKNLQKYYNARDLDDTADNIKKFVRKNLDKKSSEIISGVEKIFGGKINTYEKENEPKDLFKGLKEKIELRGNNPKEDGILNPYPQFRKFYGNFLYGGLYIFAAPAKNGKSTLLLDISKRVSKPNKVRTLYLDTELTTEQQENRSIASYAGVNEYYIRTGLWRKDGSMVQKVRAIWPEIEKMSECVDHLYVAGKPIEEVVSIVRRWKYKNISQGMTPVVIYDYIKISGEKTSDHWKEYQIIGQKATILKDLAQEIKGPVIAAIQTNAGQEVAMSRQVIWFCDMLAMFRKKDTDEIQRDGEAFGTHKLTVTESRNQGESAMGFNDSIKMPDGSYERFYLNLSLENFNIQEKGSILDVAKAMESGRVEVDDGDSEDAPF